MKKRLLAAVLCLAMLLTLLPTAALADEAGTGSAAAETTAVSSGTCGDDLTWTLDDAGTLTISGSGAMTNYSYNWNVPWYSSRSSVVLVTIGNGVTSIGDCAFSYCSSLTSVTIPDSVTSIGKDAFSGCRSLTSVTIPDSVTSIGSVAFSDCGSLTSVTIPDSVTSIGSSAFACCDSLMSVTIPDSVTSIGDCVLECCSSLTSVTIGDSVTSIGVCAFRQCRSLTSVTIPDSVTSIGHRAFRECSSLTSVTIPDSVTSIGVDAFYQCTSLTDVYYGGDEDDRAAINIDSGNDPLTSAAWHYTESGETVVASGTCGDDLTWTLDDAGTLTISGSGAMADYGLWDENKPWWNYSNSISDIVIENGVESIGKYAFENCHNLTSVTIPDSVTSIGYSAFAFCNSLTSVTIPASVTSISDCAFLCYSLTEIQVNEDNQYYCSIDGNLFSKDKTYLVQYAAGKTDESYQIPSSVTSIGDNAFYSCSSLTSVTIPDSVTSIGNSAFCVCSSLTSVTIPDSVTSIGEYAFSWCTSLTSVTISEGVTGIEVDAFSWCTSLTSVTIPDSVTSIGMNAFTYCSTLTSINIPANVTAIENGAFADCTSLTDVYYGGTEEQWNAITIGEANDPISNATIHYTEDTALRIVTQPNGGEATYGQTVTISFEAVNAKAYQWYYSKDGGETWNKLYWTGAKTNALSVEYKASRAGFQYKCSVKGNDGTVIFTEPTTITQGVAPAVEITQQPRNVCANVGETVSFSIAADNAISYQWFYSNNGGTTWSKLYWEGATTDTLTFEVQKSRYNYVYYCKLTDGNGKAYYSNRCYLSQPISLKTQPQDTTAAIGDTVNLTVSAVGVQSYQWYYSSDNGSSWKKLSWTGAKSDTLTVDVTRTRCSYLYHCELVGYDGTEVTTNNVKITAAD